MILLNIGVEGDTRSYGFVNSFYPGIYIRTPKSGDRVLYLTFPKLLFDYSSPFDGAHLSCTGQEDEYLWRPKEDVFFESGKKKFYNFNCTVKDPDKIKNMFEKNILFNISGLSLLPNGPVCLLIVDKEKINYLKGFKINIPASPVGFSDLYFQVQYCSVMPIYSEVMMKEGTNFEQIVILDVTPAFMASSVYLFLGMAIFSLILSCLIISAIIHRWKNTEILDIEEEPQSNFINEIEDESAIELKSIECDISYKTNEEKIQYYLNKIDTFFNVPPQKYYTQLSNSSFSICRDNFNNNEYIINYNDNLNKNGGYYINENNELIRRQYDDDNNNCNSSIIYKELSDGTGSSTPDNTNSNLK